jgi:hypothetical protein
VAVRLRVGCVWSWDRGAPAGFEARYRLPGADGYGTISLVMTWFLACPVRLGTDLAQGRRDVNLAVAEGFEPSEAFTSHAFEVCPGPFHSSSGLVWDAQLQ